MNPKDHAARCKPGLSVLPMAPLMEAVASIAEGRRKYAPWNWRDEPVSEVVYVDAAFRHLIQWLSGEDIDPDSGIHHVSKAIAGLLILRDAQIHGTSEDSREVHQRIDIAGITELIASQSKPPTPAPPLQPQAAQVRPAQLPDEDPF